MTTPVLVFPVINDLGLGVDAWGVDDDLTDRNRFYSFALLPAQVLDANTRGWKLTVRVRVVDVPDPIPPEELEEDGSPTFVYRDGVRSWGVHLGSTTLGAPDAIAQFLTNLTPGMREGIEVNLPSGTVDYRTIEINFDPNTSTADVFVDGGLAISDWAGAALPSATFVAWGAIGTPAIGQGNFNRVRFEINDVVPSMGWVGRGGIALGCLVIGRIALSRFRRKSVVPPF